MAPNSIPAAMASSMQGSQDHCSTRAPYRQAQEPTTYCPAAPMLNSPTL